MNTPDRIELRLDLVAAGLWKGFANASAACEDRSKTGFGQDASDLCAFVPLNFDSSLFDRPSGAASFLHLFGQLFLFRQADANEVCHHCHGLAAPAIFLANDVHTAAAFSRGRRRIFTRMGLRPRRQSRAVKRLERIVPATVGFLFVYHL